MNVNGENGSDSDGAAADWRSSRKLKTFHQIQEEAMRLFLAKGYEETTVEEIAAAAGVSHMTVYRHFPTKESLVLSDEYDPIIADEIRKRPRDEAPLDSVEHAIVTSLSQMPESDFDLFVARMRLVLSTPALQQSLWVNAISTHRVIADALIDRGGFEGDSFDLKVVAAIAAVISGVAALDWIQQPDRDPLAALIRGGFAAARRAFAAMATNASRADTAAS